MGCSASTTDTTKENALNNKSTINANKSHDSRPNQHNIALNNQNRDDWSNREDPEEYSETEEDAAIKIQSNYRGYKARKELRKKSISKKDNNANKMKEDEGATDEHKAATTIQAGFKGYKVRKEHKKTKSEGNSEDGSPKKSAEKDIADEIADIDLNDPEVEKAASKIQATFRGYKHRREPKAE